MNTFHNRRPNPAVVISVIALVVAMCGTGYAALSLPKNSVGAKQIRKRAVGPSELKKNAVRSSNVKNGSLLKRDFKVGQLAAGAQGPQGAKGATGPKGDPGSAAGFALVESGGTVLDDQSRNVTDANVRRASLGVYCVGGLSFTPRSAVATAQAASALDTHDRIAQTLVATGGLTPFGCNTGESVRIHVYDMGVLGATPAGLVDAFFTVWLDD